MMPFESEATDGSASQSLAERAVSVVDTRTRTQTLVEKTAVCITLEGVHVRDPDTAPSQAIDMAVRAGDLVELVPPGTARAYLGVPSPEVFRAAFADPTPEQLEKVIRKEAHREEPREAYIGALNALLREVRS